MQSQDERNKEGFVARRDRDSLVKQFAVDEITGQYEGEELAERRTLRSPDERFGLLEQKHDELKKGVDELKKDTEKKYDSLKLDVREVRSDVKSLSDKLGDVREEVSGAVSAIDGQKDLLNETLSIVKKSAEREHLALTSEIEVDRAEKLATVEVKKERRLDTLDAKKTRRAAWMKTLGFVTAGGGLVELLHKLGVI